MIAIAERVYQIWEASNVAPISDLNDEQILDILRALMYAMLQDLTDPMGRGRRSWLAWLRQEGPLRETTEYTVRQVTRVVDGRTHKFRRRYPVAQRYRLTFRHCCEALGVDTDKFREQVETILERDYSFEEARHFLAHDDAQDAAARTRARRRLYIADMQRREELAALGVRA